MKYLEVRQMAVVKLRKIGNSLGVILPKEEVSRLNVSDGDTLSVAGNIGVSAHNMPASGLHREMWYLNKGGMAIADVLRATTMTNAEKIGWQEEVGSLEVGKMADFLILDENPLDDILNTLSLAYTVQGGVIYDSDTVERIDLSTVAEPSIVEAANDPNHSEKKTGTND